MSRLSCPCKAVRSRDPRTRSHSLPFPSPLLTDIYCAQKCVRSSINLRIHTEFLIYIFSSVESPSLSFSSRITTSVLSSSSLRLPLSLSFLRGDDHELRVLTIHLGAREKFARSDRASIRGGKSKEKEGTNIGRKSFVRTVGQIESRRGFNGSTYSRCTAYFLMVH